MNEMGKNERDVFLSHRSTNKELVRKIVGRVEEQDCSGRKLMTWLDEAEIPPGASIPAHVNNGLEISRFFAICMTPDYFEEGSGWTHAEWHSALYLDPDNRNERILPLLLENCPYIPMLLRHLNMIDFREGKFEEGLSRLTSVLKGERLQRPTSYRGQLIKPDGRIDRQSLVAERSVPDSFPDVVKEELFCNLLPVSHLPTFVYSARLRDSLLGKRQKIRIPTKSEIKDTIKKTQMKDESSRVYTPMFRQFEDRIMTFHDLSEPDVGLESVIDESDVETLTTKELIADDDDRRIVTSLLNMALSRHAYRLDLVPDDQRFHRFYFSPLDGKERTVRWKPAKKWSSRAVAKPCIDDEDGTVKFWRHQGAYLKFIFLANRFFLQIVPTWVITEDGDKLMTGTRVTKLVNRWTGPERNMQVLYHVRFWSKVLSRGGPISIRAGDQILEVSTIPASIEQNYGIRQDRRDLLGLLDEQIDEIVQYEDELVTEATERGLIEEALMIDVEGYESDDSEEEWEDEEYEAIEFEG